MRALDFVDGDLVILDQTLLPEQEEFRRLRSTEDVAEAILTLRVRGAPMLGIVGAFGVASAAARGEDPTDTGNRLKATRPTAVNLAWAIDRVLAKGPDPSAMLAEAQAIKDEDEAACAMIAKHALEFFEPNTTVMTHCNTGALVTGGIGTALGAIRVAHEEGLGIRVLATETRPLKQGARLTAWELGTLGIPYQVCVDAAAAGLIASGEVRLVIVGADRIAANGDVANKVGTYGLALAAREAGIPFVVAAPNSTVDANTPDGSAITIEERDPIEVIEGVPARNPAFDVTPARFVTAIVTETGVRRPSADGS